MNSGRHLRLERIALKPGEDWMDDSRSWRITRVAEGEVYWLSSKGTLQIGKGEVLVVGPWARGAIRASQLSPVLLETFNFAPFLFFGLLTLEEHFFFDMLLSQKEGGGVEVRILDAAHRGSLAFSRFAPEQESQGALMQRADALAVVGAIFEEEIHKFRFRPKRYSPALQKFQELVAEMPDSAVLNYDLKGLAELCGCSTRYLNRMFSLRYGCTMRGRRAAFRKLQGYYASE